MTSSGSPPVYKNSELIAATAYDTQIFNILQFYLCESRIGVLLKVVFVNRKFNWNSLDIRVFSFVKPSDLQIIVACDTASRLL